MEPMEVEIDDSLYSRQRYVLGDSAMHKMGSSSVFISGIGGLGVEIAKNVILAGVKSVTIHDDKICSISDLSSQFFLREEDVKACKNRAMACSERLKELNPYVDINHVTFTIDSSTDLSFLTNYQCVIFTDTPFGVMEIIDSFCRSQKPPIKFIAGSVRGVACYGFCDFGDSFTVLDKNGEDPIEFFISSITQEDPAVVTCLPNERHGLEDGDMIELNEVTGMESVNGKNYHVKVISPTKFSINLNASLLNEYKNGGRAKQIKTPSNINFRSLSQEIKSPTYQMVDFAKMDSPPCILLFFLALDKYLWTYHKFPRPHNAEDSQIVFTMAQEIGKTFESQIDNVDEKLIRELAGASEGLLPPLATTLGGILAQECLIGLTGKFSPLNQWIMLDAVEVLSNGLTVTRSENDRYDRLRICVGDDVLNKLASLKLFMVGCGAIGCEMLKCYAMLGAGRASAGGHIVITDNDIIEKSNLNRQFLFRPHHIRQHKSVVAAASTIDINPDLSIEPHCYKVFPGTEDKIYNDVFFKRQNLIVNALDNVDARRYVDSRCVSNMKPLLESGTLGTKGHVQVIIPEVTESYGSQRDPPERDVPYCTLKSFPATIEHTIQWARDKFESLWSQMPSLYVKFWKTHQNSPSDVLEKMNSSVVPDGSIKVIKLLCSRPKSWGDCVQMGRIKFEKYFKHKAFDLLNTFPLDTKMPDGSMFWQSPKRPPLPIDFSGNNPLHILFVTSYARLYAEVWGISYTSQDLSVDSVMALIDTAVIPQYKPSGKKIETDESVKKPEVDEISDDMITTSKQNLKQFIQTNNQIKTDWLVMFPQSFEKDDDDNGHIDFITAASNLRAVMYSIDIADRFKTKLIAGRIVPAIATTTAAVAGLVSLELLKLAMSLPIESHRNAFMNLALPQLPLILSEPAPCPKTTICGDISYTLWTQWDIRGDPSMTLQEFLNAVKMRYKLEPTMVVLGVKMIYVPLIPGHRKRLTQTMDSLLKVKGKEYVDLTLSFSDDATGDDVPGPPVRYYLK